MNDKTDADELREILWACPAPVSARAVVEVHDLVRRTQRFYTKGQVVEMALERTKREAARVRAADVRDTLTPRRTEGERLLAARTKDIVKRGEPWIRERRRALFGTPDPPFASLRDAAAWIEAQQRLHARTPSAELSALDDELDVLIERRLEADPWSRAGLTEKDNHLDYWRPDGTLGSVVVSRHAHALHGVWRTAETMAELTGLPAATVIAWILVGIRPGRQVRLTDGRTAAAPGLRLVSWRLHHPKVSAVRDWPAIPRPQRVLLDMDVRDLTDRNLRVARREVLKFLARHRRPTLTAKQQRMLEIVERLKGPPTPKFQLSFWKRVAKQLKGEKDPIALARLYYRAITVNNRTVNG